MNHHLRTWATAAVASLFAVTAGFAQQDFDSVLIEATDLGSGVYMLMGSGGNMGLSVGEDATILIDDQFALLTDRIIAAVAEITETPISHVINTHWHFDHTGGNENLGEAGATIIAHDNVRVRMESGQESQLLNRKIEPAAKVALPVITFSEDMTMHLNGDTLRVLHVANAHTDGDAILFFENANVVHMGDVYFSGRYPFIDPESGGHVDGVIAAFDRVLDLIDDDTKVIPGHGPLASKTEVKQTRDMLVDVRSRIQAEIDAGKDLDAILAGDPLADLREAWEPEGTFVNAEMFTRLMHLMLTQTGGE